MDAFMKSILSRVLSDEIRNQKEWQEDEKKMGLSDVYNDRDYNIKRITEFMKENDIVFREN